MKSQEAKKIDQKSHVIFSKYLKKNDSLVLGLSGGPDSVFLLHQLIDYQKTIPITVIAAHLNHKIRKKQADKEQQELESIIEKMKNSKIIFQTKTLEIEKLSKKNKNNVEEEGRNQRYKYFKSLAKKHNAKYILTAHHADDNLESILMNFVRGSGLQGLSGMKEIQKFDYKNMLLRPLLTITKKEIIDWLKFHKISYFKDHTNDDTKYRRNHLRHKVIPELINLNPNLAKTSANTSQQIRETQEYLEKQANNWISRNTLNKSKTRYNAKTFRKLSPILQKNILRQIHKIHTDHTKNLETIHINEVRDLINQNIGNKHKKLGKLKILLKNNQIQIMPYNNR